MCVCECAHRLDTVQVEAQISAFGSAAAAAAAHTSLHFLRDSYRAERIIVVSILPLLLIVLLSSSYPHYTHLRLLSAAALPGLAVTLHPSIASVSTSSPTSVSC